MPSSKEVVGIVIGFVILGAMLGPLITSVDDNSGTQNVVNESVTADINNPVELQGYDLTGTQTVYDSTGTLVPSSNYTIDATAGTINVTSTTYVSDGEEISVTYDYIAASSSASTILDLLPAILAVLALAVVGWYVERAT